MLIVQSKTRISKKSLYVPVFYKPYLIEGILEKLNEMELLDIPIGKTKRLEFAHKDLCRFLSEESKIKKILRLFQFKNETEQIAVEEFIHKNSFLSRFLAEGAQEIKKFFGSQAQTFLELEIDPEEDFEELFIVIQTDRTQEEALNLLDKFDKDWFLKIIPETKNLLNVTVETKDEF